MSTIHEIQQIKREIAIAEKLSQCACHDAIKDYCNTMTREVGGPLGSEVIDQLSYQIDKIFEKETKKILKAYKKELAELINQI